MPAKDKKPSKTPEISPDTKKSAKKVAVVEEVNLEEPAPVAEEPVKAKSILEPEPEVVEPEIEEESEPLQAPEPEEKEIKTESKPRAPEITSFSQLDSKAPVSATEKTAPPKSILEPEPEEMEETQEKLNEPEMETKTDEPVTEAKKGEFSSDEIKEWLKEVRPDTTKEVEKSGGPNKRTLFTVVVALIVLGLIGGGVYYYKTKIVPANQQKLTEETTQPVEEQPTETPVPQTVDYSKYTLRVLNGSGVAGEAGKVAKLFEDVGFKEVTAGNADKSDYTTTLVNLKKDVPSGVYDKVKENLGDAYVIEKSDTPVEESSAYDIIVTVGAKKSQ